MTILEFTLSLIIYLIIGLWMCWKRNWYSNNFDIYGNNNASYFITFSLIFMPINLIIILLKEFVLREWDN
jgi:hypothetical protein